MWRNMFTTLVQRLNVLFLGYRWACKVWSGALSNQSHNVVIRFSGHPHNFLQGNTYLLELPALLDGLKLHFRRLRDVHGQQLLQLRYSSVEDFHQLTQDRLISRVVSYEMVTHWRAPSLLFVASDPYEVLDGLWVSYSQSSLSNGELRHDVL
jgi:hypothetical protein